MNHPHSELVGCVKRTLIAILLLSTVAFGQTTQPSLSLESSVDEVLDALDRTGKQLKTMRSRVEKADVDLAAGDQIARKGVVSLNLAGDAAMRVTFDQLQRNDNPPRTGDSVKQDYLLVGEWLVERNFDIKKVVRYQVRRPGEKLNLLSLGEGPFPLPIGQSREAVYSQFDVKRMPTPDERGGMIVLDLRPKEGTRLRKRFARIIVDIDPKLAMPVRIETMDRDIDDPADPPSVINVTTLSEVVLNQPLDGGAFDEGATDGWDVEAKSLDD
jgi:hypothetical protein